MTLILGIVQAAAGGGGGGGGGPIEADWRNSLPAGWAVDVASQHPIIHSSTGTYVDGVTDYVAYITTPVGEQLQEITMMVQLNVTAWSAFFISLGAQSTDYYELAVQSDGSSHVTSTTLASQGTSADLPLGVAAMTIVGLTMSSTGNAVVYLLKNGAATQTDSAPLTPGTLSSLQFVTVLLQSEFGGTPGNPGDVRLARSLVVPNVQYNQSQIEAVATSWGWS